MNDKHSKAKLIRDFFALSGADAIREIGGLGDANRLQLGSAIARERGLSEAECDFTFVQY